MGSGLLIAAHPLKRRRLETATDASASGRCRALVAQCARATGRGRCLVDAPLRALALREEGQCRLSRTLIDIVCCVVREVGIAESSSTLAHNGEWDVGLDALPLNRGEVLDCSVFGVAGDLARSKFPAKAGTPEQIECRLVLLDFSRRNEHGQDDPGAPAVTPSWSW